MRFIHQKEMTTCGPVVFINALKVLKKKIYSKDIVKIKKLLKFDGEGIYPDTLNKGFKKYNIKYIKRIGKNVTLKSIDRFLKNGYFGVLLFALNKNDSHFILILEKDKDGDYIVVNHNGDGFKEYIWQLELKSLIKKNWNCPINKCPQIWWIKK